MFETKMLSSQHFGSKEHLPQEHYIHEWANLLYKQIIAFVTVGGTIHPLYKLSLCIEILMPNKTG